VHVKITLDTLIDKIFARMITYVTWWVVFSFLNESKGVCVAIKCVSTSKLVTWEFSKNTFGISRITTRMYKIFKIIFRVNKLHSS